MNSEFSCHHRLISLANIDYSILGLLYCNYSHSLHYFIPTELLFITDTVAIYYSIYTRFFQHACSVYYCLTLYSLYYLNTLIAVDFIYDHHRILLRLEFTLHYHPHPFLHHHSLYFHSAQPIKMDYSYHQVHLRIPSQATSISGCTTAPPLRSSSSSVSVCYQCNNTTQNKNPSWIPKK